MTHGIVVEVVEGGPAVGFVANLAVRDAVPDMTAALIVFTIPKEGRSAVEFPERRECLPEIKGLDINVVVIWQKAPRMKLAVPQGGQ